MRGLRTLPAGGIRATGFTLVEVLIALALSALTLVGVYGIFFSVNRSVQGTSSDQEAFEAGRAVIEVLKRDIRCIAPAPFVFAGSNTPLDDGEVGGGVLLVTSSVIGNRTRPGLFRIEYFLTKDGDGEKVFVRRQYVSLKAESTDVEADLEISRDVAGFEVGFYDGTTWAEKWDSKATGKLPRRIKIKIGIRAESGTIRTFETEEEIASAT
jgi:prepilin-type N-terminal cleavage/methylation domain-containing protein